MAIISRNTGSILFQGLSSFWKRFFRDSTVVDSLYSATEQQLGDAYLDLMETVLSKSLNNTPVFSKRDWSLLLLKNTEVSFDPSVYSYAATDELGVRVTVTAQELSPEHDFVAFELSDSLNFPLEKKAKYPGHGIYNLGLVNNSLVQSKSWTVVVPANKTLKESLDSVSKRIITSKRIEDYVLQGVPDLEGFELQVLQSLQSQGTWDALANFPALPAPEMPSIVSPGNIGWYFEVATAGPGYNIGDWVVSTGTAWEKAEKAPPTLVFRYGNDLSNEIVLPAQNYLTIEAIRQTLQTKLSSTSVSPSQFFLGYWNAETNTPNISPGSATPGNQNGYYIVSAPGSTVIDDPNFLGYWDVPVNTPFLVTGSANAGNKDKYYVVSVAGTHTVDGVSTWNVGDRIISNGTSWYRKTTPLWQANDWVVSTGTVWQKNNSTRINITVENDGGYLIFTGDKEIKIWESNTAAENYLHLRQMRFTFSAAIPPGREKDILWRQNRFIQIQTLGYAQAGTEYRFPVSTTLRDARYIYNTLYSPSVYLEKFFHYRVGNGYIYFKDNPFDNDGLAFRDLGNGTVQLALWLSDVSLDTLTLYYNFGYRFTQLKLSSEEYKKLLLGLWYYYTHGPQVERIRSALNIIAGIPVVADNDEVVIDVTPNNLQVTTTKNTYVLPALTPAIVTVGQVLQAFDSLTNAFEVEDYVSTPGWYDRLFIPSYLMPNAPDSLRLSLKTTTFPSVGDPGFTVGDIRTDKRDLITNLIVPAGPTDYSLPTGGAYFVIEKDRDGQYKKVFIHRDETTSATTLDQMAAYVSRCCKQIFSNPVNGAGGNIFRLMSDATFTVEHRGQKHTLTVTPGETWLFVSLSQLAGLVETKLNAAFGAGYFQVYSYVSAESYFTVVPQEDSAVKIIDPDTSAQTELGLYPTTSLAGVTIAADTGHIKFSHNSLSSTSKLRIFDMNTIARDSLSMEPFQQGSGDFVGTTGDPTPGWDLMDKYLKYNTFRIRYNPNAIEFIEKSLSVLSVINSGRPLYTSAMIIPEFKFEDYVNTTDIVVDNPDELSLYLTQDDVAVVDRLVYQKASVYVNNPCKLIFYHEDSGEYSYSWGVYPRLSSTSVSSNGGSVLFKSKENTLRTSKHLIEITDLASLKLADAGTFNIIGLHNRGRLYGGVSIGTGYIPKGTIGGVYEADPKGLANNYHRLTGFDKADFPLEATHVLVIDDTMKADLIDPLDPFSRGVKTGDFFRLRNMGDTRNNGDFAILKLYHDVPYLGDESTRVDIIAYRNTLHVQTTNEVFFDSVVQPTVSFRPNSEPYNTQWLLVLPNTGSLESRVSTALSQNTEDQQKFPFDVTVVDGNWAAPTPGTYHGGLTYPAKPDQDAYYSEPYGVSWDPLYFGSGAGLMQSLDSNPDSFFIGQCNVKVQDFESLIPPLIQPLLAYQGMYNPLTLSPVLPAPAPANVGHYYFVNMDNNTNTYHNGDYIYSDGTNWVKILNPSEVFSLGEWMPDYTRDVLSWAIALGNTFGVETYGDAPELSGTIFDPWATLIGASAAPGFEPPPGYVIGGDTLWTTVINPDTDVETLLNNVGPLGGYYADVGILVTP